MSKSRPERDRNAVEEIPRSTKGATWGSGGNPEKHQGRDAGQPERDRQKVQQQLDEALADSFPASDPVSIVTSIEEEDWGADPSDPAPRSDDRSGANPQRGS